MTGSQYAEISRAPRYSILFAAPLWIAYEVLARVLSHSWDAGIRNGADVILKSPFIRLAGDPGVFIFDLLLLVIGCAIVAHDWRRNRGPIRPAVFPMMGLESLVLAFAVGVTLQYITAALLGPVALSAPSNLDVRTQLMVSLGAGIYEELLFRVIVVGLLLWLATHVFRWKSTPAALFAVGLGALAFSAFHYIGPYGDTLMLRSFLFRWLAGIVFSTLYVLRGFGITAWTHALYDVIVTLT